MLSCLAIGLASGVGIYLVAALSDRCSSWRVVWVLESLEPESVKDFLLKMKAKESGRAPGRHRERAAARTASGTSCGLVAGRPHVLRAAAAHEEDRPPHERDPRPSATGRHGGGVVGQEAGKDGRVDHEAPGAARGRCLPGAQGHPARRAARIDMHIFRLDHKEIEKALARGGRARSGRAHAHRAHERAAGRRGCASWSSASWTSGATVSRTGGRPRSATTAR